MASIVLLDAAGRRRSPVTSRGHHRNPGAQKGLRYPPYPPTVEGVVAVMRCAGKARTVFEPVR